MSDGGDAADGEGGGGREIVVIVVAMTDPNV